MALAARAANPEVRIVGVQAHGSNATYLAYHGRADGTPQFFDTIADGLAVRTPGILSLRFNS